ncbi:hypothetical protein [Staphylococcus agnetis]|uniref:hypothetical protein n=1 Tax=Staphylococcus agnetis TaxID=985762 RepID=UPI00140524FE|nr:hypothetical protein [Staphylococcus agnetis]NJI14361.1 hypothetical protein [Staphylococcus agnetis]QIN24528.1 hypothetical protein GJE18_07115 [Staphylococcus agnetis]
MKRYTIYVEEIVKNKREYTIRTDEDINNIVDDLEEQLRWYGGNTTPSDILLNNTEIEVVGYTDDTDYSSPYGVDYEIEDVMEDK